MDHNIFDYCKEQKLLVEVAMNDAKILLPGDRKAAIGTEDLNGCSAIMILGDRAIVCAHMSARATHEDDDFEAHNARWLHVALGLYNKHRNFFSRDTTTWGVFGAFGGEPLDHIVLLFQEHLKAAGLDAKPVFYEVTEASMRLKPRGQLVAVVKKDGTHVFLERRRIEKRDVLKWTLEWYEGTQGAGGAQGPTMASNSGSHPRASNSSAPSFEDEARSVQAAYVRMVNGGLNTSQAMEALVARFMEQYPAVSKQQAEEGIRARLRHR